METGGSNNQGNEGIKCFITTKFTDKCDRAVKRKSARVFASLGNDSWTVAQGLSNAVQGGERSRGSERPARKLHTFAAALGGSGAIIHCRRRSHISCWLARQQLASLPATRQSEQEIKSQLRRYHSWQ